MSKSLNMEVNLGLFKNVFLLESIYGTCTVSLITLEQSKLKLAYSGFLVLVYIGEQIAVYFIYISTAARPAFNPFYRMFAIVLPLYSIVKPMYDYKSRISAALELEAIEDQLNLNKIYVAGSSLLKKLSAGLVAANIAVQISCFAGKIFGPEHNNTPMTKHITSVLLFGIYLTQGGSLVMFLKKVEMIQSALTKALCEVRFEQQAPSTSRCQRPRNRGRRNIRMLTEVDKRWALLMRLQGSLHYTENTIRESYRTHVIWYRVVVEILTPYIVASYLRQKPPLMWGIFVLCVWLVFGSIIYAVERLYWEKNPAFNRMPTNGVEEDAISKFRTKIQNLAHIHRSRQSFSCSLFDVDYGLLASVLENFCFVVTSLIAYNTMNT